MRNPKAFLNAVIDKKSFDHIKAYLDYVKQDPDSEIIEGGGRGSGTNDKAGSFVNLYRWLSQRVIKEAFVPDQVVLYPHME